MDRNMPNPPMGGRVYRVVCLEEGFVARGTTQEEVVEQLYRHRMLMHPEGRFTREQTAQYVKDHVEIESEQSAF